MTQTGTPTPRIGFYDSHHMPSGLTMTILSFEEAGIPLINADCLCAYGKDGHLGDSLPPIAIVHPSYDLESCPETIREIAKAANGTRFFVPVLTYDNPTFDKIKSIIGELPNVNIVFRRNYVETLSRLFEELRASASQ